MVNTPITDLDEETASLHFMMWPYMYAQGAQVGLVCQTTDGKQLSLRLPLDTYVAEETYTTAGKSYQEVAIPFTAFAEDGI